MIFEDYLVPLDLAQQACCARCPGRENGQQRHCDTDTFCSNVPIIFFPSVLHYSGLVGNNLFRSIRWFLCFSFLFLSYMCKYLGTSVVDGFIDRKLMRFISTTTLCNAQEPHATL